ncbi:MAG: ion transporter [Congregibacter sp.]|nr:ion transporter [Congregibacter sp.]MDP5069721.1 ion transporter [Congregibacter sp.]
MSQREQSALQAHLYKIIFGTDTRAGKWFDLALIITILVSVAVIVADSLADVHRDYGQLLQRLEWGFTCLFSIEYLIRIWIARNRRAYLFSFYGIIDFLAILPSYLAILVPQTAPLLIIRLLRVLRVFRVLRLVGYLHEANQIAGFMRGAWRQIFVFFLIIMTIIVVFGCLIYVLEGPNNGFDNIPVSVYWAIVTVTTVGYGDVVPVTAAGRTISALAMLVGYAIIAVPTGIFTANILEKRQTKRTPLNCPQCSRAGHEEDARYCRHCGSSLRTDSDD